MKQVLNSLTLWLLKTRRADFLAVAEEWWLLVGVTKGQLVGSITAKTCHLQFLVIWKVRYLLVLYFQCLAHTRQSSHGDVNISIF